MSSNVSLQFTHMIFMYSFAKTKSIKIIDACYNFSRFQEINFIQNTRMTSSQFLNLNLKVDLQTKVENFNKDPFVLKIKMHTKS